MSDPQINQPMAPPKAHTRQQRSMGLLELPYVTVAESRPDTPCDAKAEITALRAENLRLGEENLKLAGELVNTSKSLKTAVKFWMKAEDELGKLLKLSQNNLQREMRVEKPKDEEKKDKEDTEEESDSGAYEDALDALEEDGGTLV
ncbi:uncharacterized protein H6S33_009114 [Morchella sextelata]|uniref:uncharacterized protein n=1 Tax=Morchella sextelata TaxID=1174677 RepID=UPI001D046F70|nr:uncharacterized protein H6S33_009114 [Morchella sextelata]KAH0612734.1 hypothetical protein H6S33_009114 [Morchella sextelata]